LPTPNNQQQQQLQQQAREIGYMKDRRRLRRRGADMSSQREPSSASTVGMLAKRNTLQGGDIMSTLRAEDHRNAAAAADMRMPRYTKRFRTAERGCCCMRYGKALQAVKI
jgi:hypothetical protein